MKNILRNIKKMIKYRSILIIKLIFNKHYENLL